MAMERVALYVRVSTEEQAINGDSVEAQKEELIEYAKKQCYDVIGYYIDDGYSATTLKRPNLQRLLIDIEAGKVDLVLFTKIDRWSRGVRNYYKLQDILEKHNVTWNAIFERYNTTTAEGQLHINIMLSVAENEAAVTSERIRTVFRSKLERGEVCTGNVPYGYKIENKHMVIDEKEAEVVKEIFDTYEENLSVIATTKHINRELSKSRRTIRRILGDEIYIGRHKSQYGVQEDYCPSIIPKEQFERVQRLLSLNKPRRKHDLDDIPFLFKSIAKCRYCGKNMKGNKYIKDGRLVIVYRCSKGKENRCVNRYTPSEKVIEKFLLENLEKEIQKKKAIFKNKIEKIEKKRVNTDSVKAKLQKRLTKLKDLYLDDMISKEDYRSEYTEIKSQLNKLDMEKIEQEEVEDLSRLKIPSNFKEIYNSLTQLEKRRFWCEVIKGVEIGRFKEPFKIIL